MCGWDPKEIWDFGLEFFVWSYFRDSWCGDVSTNDWFVDVLDENEAYHMICCEHIELASYKYEMCPSSCCKESIEVPEGYNWVWDQVCDGSKD